MAVVPVEELGSLVGEHANLLGLDLGTKTIGVAASDRDWRFAHPRRLIRRGKFRDDLAALQRMADAENAGAFIIGLPLNMDGSMGPRAQASKAFARNLLGVHDWPIAFWDERLSTVAAERALIGMDVSRRQRTERIDSAAAAFILQGALDRLASL